MLRVLVALDGSASAPRVLDALGPWLRAAGASADLLTVMDASELRDTVLPGTPRHELTPAGSPSGTPLGTAEPAVRMAQDRSQAIESVRAELLARLGQLGRQHLAGVPCEPHVRSAQHAAEAIVEEAERLHADVIAVGTHGRTGLRRAVMGSVAEAVLRAAPVPVFLVREGMRAPAAT
jgi:nucleotide-binding universal stress UspA family protein